MQADPFRYVEDHLDTYFDLSSCKQFPSRKTRMSAFVNGTYGNIPSY